MRTITFICLDKLGGGDIATTLEMIRSLSNNPHYSNVEINLAYFSINDPPANFLSFPGITNRVHIKAIGHSMGMNKQDHSVDSTEVIMAQLAGLLEQSAQIVFYPRTPTEGEDMCEWGTIFRQHIFPHKNKMVSVTEPSGVEEEKRGYCATRYRLHLGFHQASAGVPYPDVTSTSLMSPEAIQVNTLRENMHAKIFFIYGHKINHLARFLLTIMSMHNNPSEPIVFVIVGFTRYRNDSIKSYLEYGIFECQLDMAEDLHPSLNSWLSPENINPTLSLENTFHFMYFPRVTPSCFRELMSLSEEGGLVGCTGAHSLATAIALRKVPFYEALYPYHRGLYRDLMSLDVTMQPVLLYLEFMWNGNCHLESGQSAWKMLFDEFCRSVSSSDHISEFCQRVRIQTDIMQKFPTALSSIIQNMERSRSPSLLFPDASPDAAASESNRKTQQQNTQSKPSI